MPDTAAVVLEARDLWLSRQYSRNTRRAYAFALRSLCKHAGKTLDKINRRDVNAWLADLQQDHAVATVAARLTAVKSFYDFLLVEVQLRRDNPANGCRRPRVNPYGKATVLDIDGARALLKAIDRENIIGLRDYALFLGYLMTGRRNSEWRLLRFEDIEMRPGGLIFKFDGKGKRDQVQELYRPVMDAIHKYADLEGRDSGAVFHSYGMRGEILESSVSDNYVRRALKFYAARAGLKAESLKVHSLRHTAAMLRKEAGDDVLRIQAFLGHANLATTQVYIHNLTNKQDMAWQTVAEFLGV